MTIHEAKKIAITDYLQKKGLIPVAVYKDESKYFSFFREERTPSLYVNTIKNVFVDFGGNIGGSIVDLVLHMEKDVNTVSEALKFLEAGKYGEFLLRPTPRIEAQKEQQIITDIEAIRTPYLIEYAASRGIPRDYLELFCVEITYQNGNNIFKAIGVKCVGDGFAIRSKNFKGHIYRQGISIIEGGKNNTFAVFEGFFSYLSYLVYRKIPRPAASGVIILNSCMNWNKLPSDAGEFYLHLDNDETGSKTSRKIIEAYDNTQCYDMRTDYDGYKDWNDFINKTNGK